MSLWLLLALMGLIKLVAASLMLWIPFRSDSAMMALAEEDSSEADDEGGSKALPGSPDDPHPRLPPAHRPRRGPHGSPSPHSPARESNVRNNYDPAGWLPTGAARCSRRATRRAAFERIALGQRLRLR
jgi:hypothetical protein